MQLSKCRPGSNESSSIQSIDEWFEIAPPKGGKRQWVDGRSAKELARAWVRTGKARVPDELRALLDSHPDTRGATVESGEPEAKLAFDARSGEPCNADLVLRASVRGAPLAIMIEAKADEPFAQSVSDTLVAALERVVEHGRGNGVDRVRDLVQTLLPCWGKDLPKLGELRYQLLTAAAGSLAWARKLQSRRALLVVHEFRSDRTSKQKLDDNARDLDEFVARLTAKPGLTIRAGTLVGPIRVPGLPLFESPAELYVGKISTHLSTPGS